MRLTSVCFLLLLFISRAIAQDNPNEIIIHVAPYEQECEEATCLVIRELPDGELSLFSGEIEGFDYEAAYEYQLRVNVTREEGSNAETGAYEQFTSYEFIELVAKFPAGFANKIWELQTINNIAPQNASSFTLVFYEDGSLGINGDCNSFMASEYSPDPANITVGGMTRMFCEGSIEAEFVKALNSVNLWTIENGELILVTDAGNLRFAPPSPSRTWRLHSYHSPDMNWADDANSDYLLQIRVRDVTLMVSCNNAIAEVEFEGATAHLELLFTTLIACEEDPLAEIFPPTHFVYSINADGLLVLETQNGERFEFVEVFTYVPRPT
jgi:heat shock protein HslJ